MFLLNITMILPQICQQVFDMDYDSPTFSCMVSLPVAVMLREQAAWFLLTEKIPQLLDSNLKVEYVTSLKDVWKFVYAKTFEAKLNNKFEYNSSPFQIQLHVLYEDEETECNAL